MKRNLYRIAREALANVRRDAGATKVEVRLEYKPGELRLVVGDNGCGFDTEWILHCLQDEKKFGLIGMQERTYLLGGRLETLWAKSQLSSG